MCMILPRSSRICLSGVTMPPSIMLRSHVGQVVNLRPIGNRPADFYENLPGQPPLLYREYVLFPPSAALSFCRPTDIPDLATVREPGGRASIPPRNYRRTGLRRDGPIARQRAHRTVLSSAAGDRRYGSGRDSPPSAANGTL